MRLVVTKKNMNSLQAKSPGVALKPDDYLTKLVKYIPSEVVVLYVTLYSIASATKEEISFAFISWLIFVIGIIGTVLYLWRVAKVNDCLQLVISTIAFVVWVFALGGPFSSLSWYHPVYGALLLPVYTFSIPIIAGR